MYLVRAEAVRWSDNHFPGWVEVQLRESDGSVATLIDKIPVFFPDDGVAVGTDLPIDVDIPCDVIAREVDRAGKCSAVVRLLAGVAGGRGRATFRVSEDQLVSRS
jgi:hypothetical protein